MPDYVHRDRIVVCFIFTVQRYINFLKVPNIFALSFEKLLYILLNTTFYRLDFESINYFS